MKKKSKENSKPRSGLKILFADDEPVLQELMSLTECSGHGMLAMLLLTLRALRAAVIVCNDWRSRLGGNRKDCPSKTII